MDDEQQRLDQDIHAALNAASGKGEKDCVVLGLGSDNTPNTVTDGYLIGIKAPKPESGPIYHIFQLFLMVAEASNNG